MSTSGNLVGNLFDASIQADADGKVTIEGDLTVEGTTTSIETVNLTVEDKLIELAHGTAGTPSGDAGIIIERGDLTNASLIWDESADTWVVSTTNATGASSGDLTLTDAALKAAAITASGVVTATGFTIGSAVITEAELEILDGATLSTTELNYVDGVTSAIQTQLNTKGVTAGSSSITTVGTIGTGTWAATDIAIAHGGTGSSTAGDARTALGVQPLDADLTALSSCQTGGAAALALLTATEVAILDGATLSTAELNYVDGVTSAIQTQLNTKGVTAGSSSITTVGTIGTGAWDATVIASAKLDADTAHLTTTQTFTGAKTFSADTTFGVDDTGVDVRLFSATASEGVLYDASEDELALLLTTKLKFHDVGGGEEIFAFEDGTLKVNAGAVLDETAPIIDLNAATKIIVNSPIMQMFSGTSARPLMSLECTNPDALGGTLQFVKDGASVADNDVVGTIKFVSEDDTHPDPVVQTYATIESTISDMTAGSEGGSISIRVASHDGELQPGLTLQDGNAEDEIDVFIANGTASVTTVAGDAIVTGGDITLGAAADSNDTALVAVTESGTNTNGKVLTVGGGLGTGTGLPGSVSITSGIPGSSGSAAHNVTTVATFSTFGPTLNYGGVDALANDESVGEKVFFGTGQTVKGKLYCLNTSGAWVLTDADAEATTAALIAVACGGDGNGSANDALANGMLIRGFIDNASALTGTYNEGIAVYVDTATAGNMTVTRPSASGDFVRVLGWCGATANVIYFNPSNDYIEL